MNKWGKSSAKHRQSIDWRLNAVSTQVLKLRDHSIIQGHRPEDEQNAAFDAGNSKLRWPDGKHNSIPSTALDMRPHPWPKKKETQREDLAYLAGLYVALGSTMELTLRWGGDWDQDGESSDNRWDDLFHIEIVKDKE